MLFDLSDKLFFKKVFSTRKICFVSGTVTRKKRPVKACFPKSKLRQQIYQKVNKKTLKILSLIIPALTLGNVRQLTLSFHVISCFSYMLFKFFTFNTENLLAKYILTFQLNINIVSLYLKLVFYLYI